MIANPLLLGWTQSVGTQIGVHLPKDETGPRLQYSLDLPHLGALPRGLILCNGCQGTGSHALMDYCQALGLRQASLILKRHTPIKPLDLNITGEFIHSHLCWFEGLGHLRVINAFRAPRDALCSWARIGGYSPHKLLEMGWASKYQHHLPWLTDDHALNLWFDKLFTPETSQAISHHLGISKVIDPYEVHNPNLNPTHWREWWDDDLEALWVDKGGDEVERVLERHGLI